MARRLKSAPAVPPVCPLRVNDQLFLNAYFSNGQSAVRAYLTVHPTAKYSTAEVNGHRQLRKAKVQAEIAKRLQFDMGVSKAALERDLLTYKSWAEAKQDYIAGASIAMDCAKLAGFLVEKREVKDTTEKESQLRDLVRSSLASTLSPSCSSPSLTPTTNGN